MGCRKAIESKVTDLNYMEAVDMLDTILLGCEGVDEPSHSAYQSQAVCELREAVYELLKTAPNYKRRKEITDLLRTNIISISSKIQS